jgi:hypothetical protein
VEIKQNIMIEILPNEITPCLLDCIVLPNGEILCLGKTIGQFDYFKEYLTKKNV